MPTIIEFLEYTPLQVKTGSLGEKIVALRRVLGICQEDLARQLGVDSSTLARWEQGRGQPSDRHRMKLTRFLDIGLHGEANAQPGSRNDGSAA